MSIRNPGSHIDIANDTKTEEVVDLTADDYEPELPSKRRKSAKRERIEREFKSYLLSLDTESRIKVQRSFATVVREKENIMRLRQHYINIHDVEAMNTYVPAVIHSLETTLIQLDEMVIQLRSGKAKVTEVQSLAQEAERKTKGTRGRIEGLRQHYALEKLQKNSTERSKQQLLNDPSYVDSRSQSMVTPIATTTKGGYRPDVNPPTSNHDLLRKAFLNENAPGMLPDGNFIPIEARLPYVGRRDQARNPMTYEFPPQLPYTQLVNDIDNEEREYQPSDDNEFDSGYVTAANYDELVDLALTEAEPLDMPPQMNCTALEHQRQGLGWLVRAERGSNRGGILADDMGLGKTIQTIALFYANQPKPDPQSPNTHRLVLVVCPLALIATWADELKNRVHANHRLRVYIHHKGMNNAEFTNKSIEIEHNADIVICTYQGIVNEYKQMVRKRTNDIEAIQNNVDDYSTPRARPFPLFEIWWHRIVLDEAHIIKNKQSQMSLAASALHSRFRLALTGTPMQNRIDELFPIVRFLKIKPYSDWGDFKKLLPSETSSTALNFETQKALATFLSAVMLRRRKDTVINGRKIIDNLPPKHVEDVKVTMPPDEAKDYLALEKVIRDEVNNISSFESVTMSNMLVFLLRMRQTACHPYLIKITTKAASRKVWGNNSHTRAAVKYAFHLSPQIRALALENQSGNRICAMCDDESTSLPDTYVMGGCGHMLCADCSTEIFEKLKSDDSELFCPLCNQRYRTLANLEILDVIDNHRPRTPAIALEILLAQQKPRVEQMRSDEDARKRRLNELRASNTHVNYDNILSIDSESLFLDSEDEADHHTGITDSEDDFDGIKLSDIDNKVESDMNNTANTPLADEKVPQELIQDISGNSTNNNTDTNGTATNGNVECEIEDPLEYRLDIDEIAKLFKVPNVFNNGWVSSAKVDACLDVLRTIWREAPEDKVILFTSFTSLIDVLTIPLEAAQVPYAQYTGRMNVQERNSTLDSFKRGTCKVLLTSLKAGNVGLTLTQANRVIIVEPFWNPYVEDQAQDRVYRIGQSREVTIYRLRISETVEDRIVNLQDAKRTIIENALDNGMKTRAQGLSRTDLMYALGVRRQLRSVNTIIRPQNPISEPDAGTIVSSHTTNP